MAIDSLDTLIQAMRGGSYALPFQKSSLSNAVAGNEMSLWRAAGFPGTGAIPTSAAVCSNSLLGSLPLAPRTGAQDRAVASITMQMATVGHTMHLQDRLMHIGGLVGNSTAGQPAVVDLEANLATSNLAARIGRDDYTEVEWFLDWYTATGATVSTPTVNVTFSDNSTANLNIWVLGGTALPATVAANRRYKINNTTSLGIKAVNSVTLSASTGTAGNFGVTAARTLTSITCAIANAVIPYDWSLLSLPNVPDNACLHFAQTTNTTTSGASSGSVKQVVA